MPQFDIYSFSEQVSLLFIVFAFYYCFFIKFYLSNLFKTLKMRTKLKSLLENVESKKNSLKLKNIFL
jgi:hypothetical protein